MRVALIEDDDLHAEVVGRWMARESRVVFKRFHSATEFLDSLTSNDSDLPDVVFVDYHLGESTGAEFVNNIRGMTDARSDIGIVLFSGVDIVEFSEILEGLDVDGFLLKDDLSRERLTMVAGLAVQSSRRRQELSELKGR
jgi:two-component SAPR family response regulator